MIALAIPSTARAQADPDALLARLRAGGSVIVFRHAVTDRSRPDQDPVDLYDCATQRNLSEEGRAAARAIGEAFRSLEIPVGAVWTSPYCRSRETAELAFGRTEVIYGLERLYPVPDEAAQQRMNRLILEHAPKPGVPNMVIAGHGVYPSVLEPAVALAEGEAAIYAVLGGDVVLLGRIAPNEWADLEPSLAAGGDGNDLIEIAEAVSRSVLFVEAQSGATLGSAFHVAIPRMAVTSALVVEDAHDVSVVSRDGGHRVARVIGRAQNVGIAVLEFDDTDLPAMHSGSGLARPREGDPILAVDAGSNQSGSTSLGVVLSRNYSIKLENGSALNVLQTDAAVDPQQVGGPLVNAEGLVVGVITTIAPSSDTAQLDRFGYAIPVDVAKHAALSIIAERTAIDGD